MAHHVIYVPGLGDHRTYGQDKILSLWRLYGLRPHYFPLGWADKEDFPAKLQHLLDKIDSLKRNGHMVSLVGVSAGASAVLAAYSERKDLTAIVCICGKIQNPQTIGEHTYRKNPAFRQSMATVKDSLQKMDAGGRKKIMSIHPLKDKTVPITDTIIPGATEKTLPTRGHSFSIFYAVIFGGPHIAKFLKKQS